MFEIITLVNGEWTNDAVGQPNTFETEAEAEAAIAELRNAGPDWADAEYDVREVAA